MALRLDHVRRRAATLLLSFALLGGSAWAREERPAAEAPPQGAGPTGFLDGLSFTSSDQPIVVDANELEFDYDEQRLVYRGAVHVTQGELNLDCATLTVTYERTEGEKAQLREVIAEGDVNITQGKRRATGHRAIFDQVSRKIVLIGDPVLRDGSNEIQGDRLTVYLDEGRSVVEAGPRKRVSAVLYPSQIGDENKKASDPPAPTPAAQGKQKQ